MAAAGAVALVAPFTFTGGALALPTAPTVTTLTPSNGPAGTTVVARGTGCGTTTVPATGAQLILRGSTITDPAGQTFTATPTAGSSGGDFTGSVTIPSTARDTDTFTVTARCSDATGTSAEGTGAQFTVIASGLVGGVVTGSGTSTTGGVLSGVLSGLLSGGSGGLTGGTSTGTSATGGFGGTTGSTTGVATPITATPTFTG